jgi:hypothetical protein
MLSLIGIGRRAIIMKLCIQGIWQIFKDRLAIFYIQATPSAKCNSVRKHYAILPATPDALINSSKYFEMLPDPSGAKRCALRLCKSIVRMLRDLTDRIIKLWSP